MRLFLGRSQRGFGRLPHLLYALTLVLCAAGLILVGALTLVGVISFESR